MLKKHTMSESTTKSSRCQVVSNKPQARMRKWFLRQQLFDFCQIETDDVAVELHLKLLKDFPRDLVTLKAGSSAVSLGRPDLSLKLVEQVLPVNKHESYIYGMLAFALLELGRYADAEEAAKKGFEIDSKDAWTHHALCHVYQYEDIAERCLQVKTSGRVGKIDASPAEVYLNAVGCYSDICENGINVFGDVERSQLMRLTDKAFWYLRWHLDVLVLWALSCTGEVSKAEELLGSKSGQDSCPLSIS
ncbi:hypothetical protein HAX54_048273 [Datura stramonium]|uniref:Tetratricopeptide repeat protein 38 n=1 Tax=Datura stramonium TaxID=4076 RepID=A0ABS8SU33_DATST|nr:hypothetical protein [Datura stramonium]